MKKIALFISSLQKGGSERVMVNLAEYFYRQGTEVVVVTQYKKETEYDIIPEIRRVYSEPDEELLQGNRANKFMVRFRYLRNIWKTENPDVILAFLGKNNLMAIATSRFLPVKTVVSVRGEPTMEYEGRIMQSLAKVIFRFADGIVLQTQRAMEFFPKSVQRKAVVLPNPLNPLFLKKKQIAEKDNIIVAAGRLDDNKNHAMLIHAFARIASEYPNIKLIIYGEGECREQLERLIEEKELTDRITLPGSVTDIADRIAKARIFTLTSNTEGMPNSIMEAMALGIPVISTDCPCGGPATLIRDGENGLLIPVGDAYALADAMRQILSNPGLEHKLGEYAYKITEELTPEKVDNQWKKYLEQVAAK